MKNVKMWCGVLSLAVCLTAWQGLTANAEDGEGSAKHSIEDVMKTAMKGGLLKKVTGGEASDEEKKQLLDLFVSLVENEPEKGELDSWHKMAGGAALAAAKVVVGREGAVEELKKATNCKACHDAHKGE
ncbi:MAG: hypothetical protein KDA87_17685 [Planctomycetales bacterium]|nr:hypothetical protein [Planctomycetales bacterium]